jgi:hypothetical protein
MSRTDDRAGQPGRYAADPWRAPLVVAQLPETGLHREIEAGRSEREAMAEIAGLRDVRSVRAFFDVMPKNDGRVHVTGRVHALIGQTCVVTLDPIENEIDEEIDLEFAPPGDVPTLGDLVEEAEQRGEEVPDAPEPIVAGVIDLGRVATDALFLAIDPYPRKPGAVFEPQITSGEAEDHPFAALKALQTDPKQPRGKKPRDA